MKKSFSIVLFIALLVISLLPSCQPDDIPKTEDSPTTIESEKAADTAKNEETAIDIHFIDVGQADSILIKTASSSMLIDGGNNADAPKLKSYLKKLGITELDYVIGTHPHEDHIGGLDDVIRSFKIGKIIMPKVAYNTKTYENLLIAIRDKGMKVTTAKAGLQWELDTQTRCKLLSPISDSYEDINDYSVVIKLTYGNTAFLFTGDAGTLVENEMLRNDMNLNADVLKVAHHGSKYSTSDTFLKAVSPQYAVISVGADNDYGHPHEVTLQRLKKVNTFRTDIHGTIIITSDGNKISVMKEKKP